MTKQIFLLIGIGLIFLAGAQELPKGLTPQEKSVLKSYYQNTYKSARLETTQKPDFAVRTPGEWEEVDGVIITWRSYPAMHRDIIRALQSECKIYVVTTDSAAVKTNITNNGGTLHNVRFIHAASNSVWVRDYGPNTVYTNTVDSLIFVDWVYNRPRPNDDVVSLRVAERLGVSIFSTTQAPYNLVHTGGNFMSDGFGTAFSSDLVDEENTTVAGYGVNKTPAEVDSVLKKFMGITRNIKLPSLPYDGIHHIDMHMKLLDEETLLVGQYPEGVSDGPQIEANLKYIMDSVKSVFGTPYKIVRIPMPVGSNGRYPNQGGNYFTYANALIANKKVIVPVYGFSTDAAALEIYRKAMPGYTVIGINSNASISSSGALHCITKEIGARNPMLISHQALRNTTDTLSPVTFSATIAHTSGIKKAELLYRWAGQDIFNFVDMASVAGMNDRYAVTLPNPGNNKTVEYYFRAESHSGKVQVRPMPAPSGFYSFTINHTAPGIATAPGVNTVPSAVVTTPSEVTTTTGRQPQGSVTSVENPEKIYDLYPNPTSDIINIKGDLSRILSVKCINSTGVEHILYFNKAQPVIDVSFLKTGVYTLVIHHRNGFYSHKIFIHH